MKRTKFLALALAVAVMLMGAGYAAWNETLVITNKVSTGNVDVDMTSGSVNVTTDNLNNRTEEVEALEQQATITVTNLYPGAIAVATINVKNNSTIPVVHAADAIVTNAPEWLTVTTNFAEADELAVGEDGTITVTMVVGDDAPEDYNEDLSATFTITTNYNQWN
ncbi:SipW-dependent-type signal peptide-containing protein [Proteiniborus sp.]|uniref:SipW-dependent-type signal peptide-containing protein n=1 Tax=Proteiniborus sp. TaxID=2079015 RepID=UPI003332B95C